MKALREACIPINANVATVIDLAAQMRFRRRHRPALVIAERLGLEPLPDRTAGCLAAGDLSYRKPVHGTLVGPLGAVEKAGSIFDRLADVCRKEVLSYASIFRRGAAGGSSVKILLTSDPGQVRYYVRFGQNWDLYRGRFKGRPALEDHHEITVPHSWRTRVERRGLAVLGGMLTLDASPLERCGEVELYRAVWAAQGRGYTVLTHSGVIGRLGEVVTHGADVPSVLRSLAAKLRWKDSDTLIGANSKRLDPGEFARRCLTSARPDSLVTLADAYAVGACKYGVRSWCHATGLDYASGAAPLDQVLEAYRKLPQPEVRAAVLRALRRRQSPRRRGL